MKCLDVATPKPTEKPPQQNCHAPSCLQGICLQLTVCCL
jgi:hypothetical protein